MIVEKDDKDRRRVFLSKPEDSERRIEIEGCISD